MSFFIKRDIFYLDDSIILLRNLTPGISIDIFFALLPSARVCPCLLYTSYRYKGRRPQTKEAALVMLADSVQAAVQAINSQDSEQVKDKVFKVINSKMQEGQLADCPLTFKDLEVISQSFLMVLSGMNHQRINYPDSATEALTEGTADENKTENN